MSMSIWGAWRCPCVLRDATAMACVWETPRRCTCEWDPITPCGLPVPAHMKVVTVWSPSTHGHRRGSTSTHDRCPGVSKQSAANTWCRGVSQTWELYRFLLQSTCHCIRGVFPYKRAPMLPFSSGLAYGYIIFPLKIVCGVERSENRRSYTKIWVFGTSALLHWSSVRVPLLTHHMVKSFPWDLYYVHLVQVYSRSTNIK